MSCEQCKTVIVEAAAAGEADAVLQSHLERCASCRAIFFDERELFSAIDGGVSRAVNQPPSADFLTRVRTAIELENSAVTFGSPKYWFTLWPITATVVAVCVALLIAGRFRPNSIGRQEPATTVAVPRESVARPLPPTAVEPATKSAAARNVPSPKSVVNRESRTTQEPAMAEVLVPSDEREALAHFVAGLPARREVAIALARPAAFEPPPDATASGPLEIAKLEVKPLIPVEEK